MLSEPWYNNKYCNKQCLVIDNSNIFINETTLLNTPYRSVVDEFVIYSGKILGEYVQINYANIEIDGKSFKVCSSLETID